MHLRVTCAIVGVALFATAIEAGQSQESKSPAQKRSTVEKSATAAPRPPVALDFSGIFSKIPDDFHFTRFAHGMIMVDGANTEVVVVRINDDGSHEHACVNTEKAARSFMEGSATKRVAPSKAEEK